MTMTMGIPLIKKTPGVCGGSAYIRDTRIPVWVLVRYRQLGLKDSQIMGAFSMDENDLLSAFRYESENPKEIQREITENDSDSTAAHWTIIP
jgi:uncharacterized protein (DUF433 family)